MRLVIAIALVGILAGCAELPGPDALVKTESAAIALAKEACKPVRTKQETDSHFALRIAEYGGTLQARWDAVYSDGVWEAGSGHKYSGDATHSKKCHDLGARINATTGIPSECVECVVVG